MNVSLQVKWICKSLWEHKDNSQLCFLEWWCSSTLQLVPWHLLDICRHRVNASISFKHALPLIALFIVQLLEEPWNINKKIFDSFAFAVKKVVYLIPLITFPVARIVVSNSTHAENRSGPAWCMILRIIWKESWNIGKHVYRLCISFCGRDCSALWSSNSWSIFLLKNPDYYSIQIIQYKIVFKGCQSIFKSG